MNEYDNIAPHYDRLKKLIFQQKLSNAAAFYLDHLHDDDKVLILGGGSGDLLSHLPQDSQITYLDKSLVMLDLAKKNATSNVNFIHADFLNYESDQKYDWILCPFFLDVFNEDSLKTVIRKMKSLLSKNGKLIVTDFQKGNLFQNILVRGMYLFFQITTRIQTKKLLDFHQNIVEFGFSQEKCQYFTNQLIFSRIYSS